MGALPRLALLLCIKAQNVTHSPNAPWGARDYCVHESKIEAYCWEISEALSLAIPEGQRKAQQDGKGIMLFFLRVKRNTVKLLWWAQRNLRYPDPALRAWWEEECWRLREHHFINCQHALPKNMFIGHWAVRYCVFLHNLTKSSWPWDTSRWPEPRIFSSSWPALSLDSKIWKKHKLWNWFWDQNIRKTWGWTHFERANNNPEHPAST